MAHINSERSGISYNALKAEIRQGKWRRLYVLGGEETFLSEKLVEALTERLIQPAARSVDRLMVTDRGQGIPLDFDRLQSECMTPPFCSDVKLIVVRQSGWFSAGTHPVGRQSNRKNGDSEDKESSSGAKSQPSDLKSQLADLFARLPESVCLVFIEDKVDRRQKKLVQAIQKAGVLAFFDIQKPWMLQQWIVAECKRKNLIIHPTAAQSLMDRCENQMHVISQELTKLFLYCQSSGENVIDLPLIDRVSLPDLHGTIFDLTDALSAGRGDRALRLTDVLIQQRQPVPLILFMLARHLRQLICAAETSQPAAIANMLGVPPFVASRLARQAQNLSIDALESLYARCVDTDLEIKSGKISDRLALETLLCEQAASFKAQTLTK